MTSDEQFTALGKSDGHTPVGFQTSSTTIDRGGEFSGINEGIVTAGGKVGVEGTGRGSGDTVYGIHGIVGRDNSASIGVCGESSNDQGVGIRGKNTREALANPSPTQGRKGYGVWGTSTVADGVHGDTDSDQQSGVSGTNSSTTGGVGVSGNSLKKGIGVSGTSFAGIGVLGTSDSEIGEATNVGVLGRSKGGPGVRGFSTMTGPDPTFDNSADGVVGETSNKVRSGVWGNNTGLDGGFGVSGSSVNIGTGVWGTSKHGVGVKGQTSGIQLSQGFVQSPGVAVQGECTGQGTGISGSCQDGIGVIGQCDKETGTGVRGQSLHGYGGTFAGGLAPIRLEPSNTSGPPTTGQHDVGELFVDKGVNLFICIQFGTPGVWKKVQLVSP